MNFQKRVQKWMHACFGEEISADRLERGDRFLEEVIELLQSVGYPRERISALEDYVYSRPVGHPPQEVGGVMVTFAAFCEPHGLDMTNAGEDELFRCWRKIEAIRAKQASKPVGSALPVAIAPPPPQTHVERDCCCFYPTKCDGTCVACDDPAPVTHLVGGEVYATAPIVLTEWERTRLSQHVASNALTYMGHHARGGLRPHEIEEMERWNALSDKLKAALASEGQAE
ncbi:hypothetical protein ABK249_02890 [Neorhizobium sp. Rsf11]|uniref:Uncharacterized protein n=1 Tax=Neorhizobium phenanthreniclasticum TaxID=3157917 RepID=A0ABV0LW93_9HYPH